MLHTKCVEKIRIHVCTVSQATANNTRLGRERGAITTGNNTNTDPHSEYVIFTVFQLYLRLLESASTFVTCTLPVLFYNGNVTFHLRSFNLRRLFQKHNQSVKGSVPCTAQNLGQMIFSNASHEYSIVFSTAISTHDAMLRRHAQLMYPQRSYFQHSQCLFLSVRTSALSLHQKPLVRQALTQTYQCESISSLFVGIPGKTERNQVTHTQFWIRLPHNAIMECVC